MRKDASSAFLVYQWYLNSQILRTGRKSSLRASYEHFVTVSGVAMSMMARFTPHMNAI